jgi:L-threonylcarbamoyladenylate synthase
MEETQASRTTRVYAGNSAEGWDEALWALRTGELVVFPTDTVYGVGCDVWEPQAIERLYWAKWRPKRLPIPVLVSAPEHIYKVVERSLVSRSARHRLDALTDHFWPGQLTVILPRRPYVPDVLCAGGPTVAVRMPDQSLALRLIAEMGGALAATSANRSGQPDPRTAEQALADLEGRVDVVLDDGPCPGGIASSIVDLVSDTPALLREGALAVHALRRVVPEIVVPRRA